MNEPQRPPDNKFYWLKLKKQLSKAGKTFYTGNFAYAVDIIGFEKDDGTVTLWLKPKDMDQMKQQQRPSEQQRQARPPGTAMQQFGEALSPQRNNQQAQQQRPTPNYAPQKQPFVDHTKTPLNPPPDLWDDGEEIPF